MPRIEKTESIKNLILGLETQFSGYEYLFLQTIQNQFSALIRCLITVHYFSFKGSDDFF